MSTFKEYIAQLETAEYNTAMTLLFDILTKLESGIFPSQNEVQFLNNEATKAWNYCSNEDLEQKLNMSKIRLFCKSFEVLFCEKTKTFKPFELLEPNAKNFLSKFVNTEIAKLEEICGKNQLFIDEIDQIKRLSYSTIKKADFAFESDGEIFKYWTLNKNMVPEGEDDSLESKECIFNNICDKEVILKFKVFSDLQSNWIVRVVSSEPFVSELLFSLCVSEKTNSALSVPSLFFPAVYKEENTENVKSWSLDMKHLHYPDKEATLIFSFVGAMDKEDVANDADQPPIRELELIKRINEFEYELPLGPTVSLSLVICNFMQNILLVKDPFLTSGKLDSGHPWPRKVDPTSVTHLYTKKRKGSARGSVGTSVLTVQHEMCLVSLAVHWQSPFDFNLYENSFAVFALPGQDFTSEDAANTFKDFIEYSNIGKNNEKYIGIRGFAKDGPKAFEYRGLQISAKMGVNHVDSLQLAILPANKL